MGRRASRPHALPSEERVRRRPEFEKIYGSGTKLHGRFMTVFILAKEKNPPRLGVAATKKIGTAVVRNRAKRLARELFRCAKPERAVDVVIVPRREMLKAPLAAVAVDYRALLNRHHRQGGTSRDRSPRPPDRDSRV